MVRNGKRIWVLHWVDDLLMVMDEENMRRFRIELERQFDTSYKGPLEDSLYLGMTVQRWWTPRPGDGFKGFKLTQPHLVEHLLTVGHGHLPKKYDHQNIMMGDVRLSKHMCPATDAEREQLSQLPYRQLLGKAGYFAINTMPQISYPVKELARFSTNFGHKHWEALVRLCCYIRDNKDLGLYISGDRSNMVITGYSDADWNGVVDSNLSTTGWVVYLGDVPVSWCSRTQKCTSRSTAESEYIALSSVAQEIIYIRSIWASMHNVPLGVTNVYLSRQRPGCESPVEILEKSKLFSDSAAALAQAQVPWTANKLRHIKTAFHFFKSYVEDQQLDLHHKSGKTLVADILTKGFGPVGERGHKQQSDLIHAFTKQLVGYPVKR